MDNKTIKLKVKKELMDLFALYKIEINSLENLFVSYINNTTEEANKINLEKFITVYQKYIAKEYTLLSRIIEENELGINLASSNIIYDFDKEEIIFVA